MDMNEIKETPLQLLAKAFTDMPFNQTIGLHLTELKADQVVLTFDMKNELVGNFLHGLLHGGVISSVLDIAGGVTSMAAAINSHHGKSVDDLISLIGKTSTVDLNIHFLNPGRGKTFTAKAQLIKLGKKISFTRMELFNEEGSLIASGSATYLIN